MRLSLDSDAVALLSELAPGPRKQGDYVSALIREAAARRRPAAVDEADVPELRRLVGELAREVDDLKRRLS